MRLTIAAAVACLLGGVSIADDARAAIRRPTHIPEQNLGEALQALAKDRNVQVVYFSTVIDSLKTRGATGELTTDEAFEQVLSGTGYTWRYLGEKTITIVPVTTPRQTAPGEVSGAPKQSQVPSFWSRFRLAQSATPSAPASTREAPEDSERTMVELEEIIVTGSHIRGVQNPTVPVTILDKEYIDSTGLSTTTRLIESLPQNFALANQSTSSGAGVGGGTSASFTQGSSINLRAMGEGTTLVLVNGRRLASGYEGSAVDISALPLSAVERVEIVTDGASALYGSDAVGGVVNFVLRRDYEGAETRLRAGHAVGTDEYRASQTLGAAWDSGNIVVSGEYYHRDLLRSASRDFGTDSGVSTVGSLLPRDENYSFMASGKQRLSDAVELFGDALYTHRDTFNIGTRITPTSFRSYHPVNAQLSSALGVGWDIGNNWRLETHASYGSDDVDSSFFDPRSSTSRSSATQIDFDLRALDMKVDGPVVELPGGTARVAVGATRRMEELRTRSRTFAASGAAGSNIGLERDRDVDSVFAEAFIPLVGDGNSVSLVRGLELSIAVRYDDYSDFGSSTDPRYGIAWEPLQGLRLRGSWGTSYLAPKLSLWDTSLNAAQAYYPFDPGLGRTAHTLVVGGNAPDSLVAQESENYTIGLEWAPSFTSAKFTLGYYDIDYQNRISLPPTNPALIVREPGSYGDLFIRNPSVEQVNQYIGYGLIGQGFLPRSPTLGPVPNFNPASVEVIVDLRRRNMSVIRTNGIDLSARYDLAALGGQFNLGFDGTYILELVHQVTDTSAPIDQVDTFSNPPHMRLRGQLGYRSGGWALNGFVNYKNSYDDNRFTPAGDIASWTTVDANISYRFGKGAGLLSQSSISLGAMNLFDKDPPRTRVRPNDFDLGFDPTNASPLGRLVSIDLTKTW